MSLTLTLMKRDAMWKFLPLGVVAGLAVSRVEPDGSAMSGALVGLAGTLYAAMLGAARATTRASAFEAALPVDGRDLLRARVITLLTFIWLPVAVFLAAALAGFTGLTALPWLLCAALAASTGVMILQLTGLPALGAGLHISIAVWVGAFSGGLGLALLVPQRIGLEALVGFGFLLVGIAWYLWPRGPVALQVAPVAASASDVSVPGVAGDGGSAGLAQLFWRGVASPPALIWFSFAGFYPLLNNLIMPLCFLPGYLTYAYFGTRWMFALPIPRRRLLAATVVPYLAIYAMAMLINLNWGLGRRDALMVDARAMELRVASIYWQHTDATKAPLITAPWGESYQQETRRVWLVRSWNPWAYGPHSSRQFREWQFRRATKATYGQEVGIDEASKLEQLQPLVRRPAEQFLTITTVLGVALYLMLISYVPRWRRISHLPAGLRKYGALTLSLGPIVLAAFSPIFGMPLGNSGIFEAVALRFGDVLRANPLPVGGLVLAVLGAGYWTAQKLFSELEPDSAPMPSGRKSWARGGLFGV